MILFEHSTVRRFRDSNRPGNAEPPIQGTNRRCPAADISGPGNVSVADASGSLGSGIDKAQCGAGADKHT